MVKQRTLQDFRDTYGIDAVVSVDPGKSGAIAVLDLRGKKIVPSAHYMPLLSVPSHIARNKKLKVTDRRPLYDMTAIRKIMRDVVMSVGDRNRVLFVVEDVGARRGDGIIQAFNFGYGSALILATIVGLRCKPATTLPTEWRVSMVGAKTDKAESQRVAAKLFPQLDFSLAKSEALAEAILIGYFAIKRVASMLQRRTAWPRSPLAAAQMLNPPPRKSRKKARGSKPTTSRKASTKKGSKLPVCARKRSSTAKKPTGASNPRSRR